MHYASSLQVLLSQFRVHHDNPPYLVHDFLSCSLTSINVLYNLLIL